MGTEPYGLVWMVAPSHTSVSVITEQAYKLTVLTEGAVYAKKLSSLLMDCETSQPPEIQQRMLRETDQYAQLVKDYQLGAMG